MNNILEPLYPITDAIGRFCDQVAPYVIPFLLGVIVVLLPQVITEIVKAWHEAKAELAAERANNKEDTDNE